MSPTNRQPLIRARNLVVTFLRWGQRVVALDGVTLDVMPGEWIGLVGHNGAGKSTLLNVIGGVNIPNSGLITVSGRKPSALNPRDQASTLFMVHQNPLLGTAPLLTVYENLRVADSNPLGGRARLLEKYRDLLDPVGLGSRLNQPAKVLSGGERQLLALAIAGLRRPHVLLLDEPLAALDPQKARLCLDVIGQLHREAVTIVQVTHAPEMLRGRADRILVLDHGRLQTYTTNSEVHSPTQQSEATCSAGIA